MSQAHAGSVKPVNKLYAQLGQALQEEHPSVADRQREQYLAACTDS